MSSRNKEEEEGITEEEYVRQKRGREGGIQKINTLKNMYTSEERKEILATWREY